MECKHKHRFVVWLLTIVSLVALFLHMASHFIPILITNETIHKAIEPFLHSTWLTVVAWSFLPIMIYHFWMDKKIHSEMHRLQEENKRLKEERKFIRST